MNNWLSRPERRQRRRARRTKMCTSKRYFATELDALAATRGDFPLAYYACSFCDGFHLTSQVRE